MRCTAYCTAKAYELSKIAEFLKAKNPIQSYGEVLYSRYKRGEIFCFDYGCIVFWNISQEDEAESLKFIRSFEKEPLSQFEYDDFEFSYGKASKVFQGEIFLENAKDVLAKLAVSYGLAQSVKLSVYEGAIEQVLAATDPITQSLAKKGKIPLSQRDIGRKIGELFLERNTINVQSDFLEPPDFFWENPEYEPLYKMAATDLDIRARALSLNRKLDMIHDLYQILGDELNHRQSARLEWTVIILILIEVLFTTYSFFQPHFSKICEILHL